MRSSGFSLVEMVLIMAMVAILMTIGTFAFHDYSRRYRTEAQTRLLFSELLKARVNAVCQRRGTRVKLYPGKFEIYSSQHDDASGVKPLRTHLLSYPVTIKHKNGGGPYVAFGSDGVTYDALSVCLEPSVGSGAVDSITVSMTRITIGKKDKGDDCNATNITVR